MDINFLSEINAIKPKKNYFLCFTGLLCFFLLIYTGYHHIYLTPTSKKPVISTDEPCKNQNCFLVQTPLSLLALVGNIIGSQDTWAFIATPRGSVIKVQKNDRISDQYSQVIEIQPTYIKLKNEQKPHYIILPLGIVR